MNSAEKIIRNLPSQLYQRARLLRTARQALQPGYTSDATAYLVTEMVLSEVASALYAAIADFDKGGWDEPGG